MIILIMIFVWLTVIFDIILFNVGVSTILLLYIFMIIVAYKPKDNYKNRIKRYYTEYKPYVQRSTFFNLIYFLTILYGLVVAFILWSVLTMADITDSLMVYILGIELIRTIFYLMIVMKIKKTLW